MDNWHICPACGGDGLIEKADDSADSPCHYCKGTGKVKATQRAKKKAQARPARWVEAAQRAHSALEDLVAIQEEFKDWLENLPENVKGSALGEKLDGICDLDLEGALDTAQEALDAEIPLGFGRD